MIVILVTGTSTGVGKTIATAALTTYLAEGRTVAVVKPTQTGAAGDEPSDAATVARLTGAADVVELVTLEDPLAPDSAARLRDIAIPEVAELAERAVERFAGHDVLVVEGAGGVLVRLDTAGGTLVDLADRISAAGHDVRFVVVTTPSLGTLNHTELTVDLLHRRGHSVSGLILGSVDEELGLAETCNLADLPRVTGLPLLASLPAGAGVLDPAVFQREAAGWFASDAPRLLTGRPMPEDSTAGS